LNILLIKLLIINHIELHKEEKKMSQAKIMPIEKYIAEIEKNTSRKEEKQASLICVATLLSICFQPSISNIMLNFLGSLTKNPLDDNGLISIEEQVAQRRAINNNEDPSQLAEEKEKNYNSILLQRLNMEAKLFSTDYKYEYLNKTLKELTDYEDDDNLICLFLKKMNKKAKKAGQPSIKKLSAEMVQQVINSTKIDTKIGNNFFNGKRCDVCTQTDAQKCLDCGIYSSCTKNASIEHKECFEKHRLVCSSISKIYSDQIKKNTTKYGERIALQMANNVWTLDKEEKEEGEKILEKWLSFHHSPCSLVHGDKVIFIVESKLSCEFQGCNKPAVFCRRCTMIDSCGQCFKHTKEKCRETRKILNLIVKSIYYRKNIFSVKK
jgi:hypothetical protein